MKCERKSGLLMIAAVLLLAGRATANQIRLPDGMGGVPDIGDIPCSVFNEMLVIGPLGTRHSLLTWADGYYYAKTGKTMDEILRDAAKSGQSWDFQQLTDHFANYCEENPENLTREAVSDLAKILVDS